MCTGRSIMQSRQANSDLMKSLSLSYTLCGKGGTTTCSPMTGPLTLMLRLEAGSSWKSCGKFSDIARHFHVISFCTYLSNLVLLPFFAAGRGGSGLRGWIWMDKAVYREYVHDGRFQQWPNNCRVRQGDLECYGKSILLQVPKILNPEPEIC